MPLETSLLKFLFLKFCLCPTFQTLAFLSCSPLGLSPATALDAVPCRGLERVMSERHELFLQRLEPSWPSLTNSSIVCVAGPSPSRKAHSQKTHGEMHGLENETPKEVLYEVAVCIRLYRLGRGRGCKLRYLDAVRTAFDVVNFSVGRPGLQWLLHFLVLWPRAGCLAP